MFLCKVLREERFSLVTIQDVRFDSWVGNSVCGIFGS